MPKVLEITKDGEYEIDSLNGSVEIAPGVRNVFISKLSDSNITIDIKEDITMVFLHNTGSSKSYVELNVVDNNAHLKAREVVLTTEDNVFDKEVVINHKHKNTHSDYKFFGFAIGKSQLLISAKSKVARGMSGSEAHQIIRALVEGDAKAQGQPGLFIDDFDVKASHGNSIGQVNERDLYYLQTKGLDRLSARWMIIKGQMTEGLSGLSDEQKDQIISSIETTLQSAA